MPTFRLHTAAPGFVGWLKQQVGGVSPDETDRVLRPTIDVSRLYGRLKQLSGQFTFPLANWTGTGFIPCVGVRGNQRWQIQAITVSTLHGTGTIHCGVQHEQRGDGSVVMFTPRAYRALGRGGIAGPATLQQATASYEAELGFIVEPGCNIGLLFSGATVATADVEVNFSVAYLELPT